MESVGSKLETEMKRHDFACIAEAGAYYYERGFRTVHETDNEFYERVMQLGDDFVTIRKIGFLTVEVIEDLNVWGAR